MCKPSLLYYDELETPVGPVTLIASDKGICRIDYGYKNDLSIKLAAWEKRNGLYPAYVHEPDGVRKAKDQLIDYFNGNRKVFHVDVDYFGTPFQQSVWKALYERVPFGETRSYKDIAQAIQSPKAVRAVGGAVNKNPLSIIIPCHRVIGADGKLVGYAGGLETKKQLLTLEKAPIDVS